MLLGCSKINGISNDGMRYWAYAGDERKPKENWKYTCRLLKGTVRRRPLS